MCANHDCSIFENCDKEGDQTAYCRKVELLVRLSKLGKIRAPRVTFVPLPIVPPVLM